jgi:hypothetical protein
LTQRKFYELDATARLRNDCCKKFALNLAAALDLKSRCGVCFGIVETAIGLGDW